MSGIVQNIGELSVFRELDEPNWRMSERDCARLGKGTCKGKYGSLQHCFISVIQIFG